MGKKKGDSWWNKDEYQNKEVFQPEINGVMKQSCILHIISTGAIPAMLGVCQSVCLSCLTSPITLLKCPVFLLSANDLVRRRGYFASVPFINKLAKRKSGTKKWWWFPNSQCLHKTFWKQSIAGMVWDQSELILHTKNKCGRNQWRESAWIDVVLSEGLGLVLFGRYFHPLGF